MEGVVTGWFTSWILETWLLSAQMFSTYEFAQLAVKRLMPRAVSWFIIILMPFGFVLDDVILHFNISVGVMCVMYITFFYLLKPKVGEGLVLAVLTAASLSYINYYAFGSTLYAWMSSAFFVALILLYSAILFRFPSKLGLISSNSIAVLFAAAQCVTAKVSVGDCVVAVLMSIMSVTYATNRSLHEKLVQATNEAVHRDELTNAMTRRGLERWLKVVRSRGVATGIIVFCDLDDFKWVNDTWGHEVGDLVLKEFVRRIDSGLRQEDALVRFGGDEYQIWIPTTEEGSAQDIVERLHLLATAEGYDVMPTRKSLQIGVSMGWAYGILDAKTANRADSALLIAKRKGKNRVIPLNNNQPYPRQEDPQSYWLNRVFTALWSQSTYPAVLTNRDGKITVANQAYKDSLGQVSIDAGAVEQDTYTSKVFENMWRHAPEGQPWCGSFMNQHHERGEWWEISELFPVILSGQVIGYWGVVQELNAARFPTSQGKNNYNWLGDIDWMFQPIVDTATNKYMGYEALARPKWGDKPVTPDIFFQMAERFEAYSYVDWVCLDSLLAHLKNQPWPSDARLFVNVYAATMQDHERLRGWLREFYVYQPEVTCVFEILEHHIQPVDLEIWRRLQSEFPLIELAQDDFGVGEQDLTRLVHLKPDWVKLDRSWATMITEQPGVVELLDSILNWAKAEGVQFIIEGIETVEQSQAYRQLGITYEQGYLWSKPQKALQIV